MSGELWLTDGLVIHFLGGTKSNENKKKSQREDRMSYKSGYSKDSFIKGREY